MQQLKTNRVFLFLNQFLTSLNPDMAGKCVQSEGRFGDRWSD